MAVTDKLSSSLGTKSQKPNQELAEEIIRKNDLDAIKELVDNLNNKKLQGDCLKALYEIGEKKPGLIAGFVREFLALLDNKNNRMVWGAMTALDCISAIKPDEIYPRLAKIMEIVDKGSVITKDHGVGILANLAKVKKYSDNCLTLLLEIIQGCAVNQLAMYAEKSLPVITSSYKKEFIRALNERLETLDQESKRKRISTVIRKLEK